MSAKVTKEKNNKNIKKRMMGMLIHLVSTIFGFFFFAAALLMLIWGTSNVHPGIEENDDIASGSKLDIPDNILFYNFYKMQHLTKKRHPDLLVNQYLLLYL